jgi:hypothetical protein
MASIVPFILFQFTPAKISASLDAFNVIAVEKRNRENFSLPLIAISSDSVS